MLRPFRDFASGFRSGIRAVNVDDERVWSSGAQFTSSTGITVTPKLAFQVSCWFQGCRLIAETLGTLPLKFLREDDEGNHSVERRYWLRPVLNTRKGRANEWQKAQQWRELMTMHAISWGTGYSEIMPSRDRPISLVPLDPGTTTPEQLVDRRLRFKVVRSNGQTDPVMQDRMFRLPGIAIDPLVPMNLLSLARETIGLWLAIQKYDGLYFAQGARPSLYVKHPGKPDPEVLARLKENMREWQGVQNMHRIFVGEQGMDVQTVGWSAKDSLLPEQMQEIALDVARWLNIPQHMFRVGSQPTFASIEQFAREFVDYTIRPWVVRWEGALDDLIPEEDIYAQHNLDALLRGNLADRCTAYASAIMNGWLSEDEVRELEDRNPIPGGAGAVPRRSVNQDRGAEPRQSSPPSPQQQEPKRKRRDDSSAVTRRARLIVAENAERVVRREVGKVRENATRLAAKPDEWATWLASFYADHRVYVADALQLEPALARGYAERHRQALLAGGVAAAEAWEVDAVAELVALTLEEEIDERTAAA
jgi:HK97 family phage portal protein